MFIGIVIIMISGFFGVIGFLIFIVGGFLYVVGLYFWSIDVDLRLLLFFVGEIVLIVVGVLVFNMLVYCMEFLLVLGFKIFVLLFLVFYFFIVVFVVFYWIRMGFFVEEIGEFNFNFVGNLVFIGVFLFFLFIGIFLYNIGKFVEFFSFWKVFLVGIRIEGLFFVLLKKIVGIVFVMLVFGGMFYYFIKFDYDFEIIKKD